MPRRAPALKRPGKAVEIKEDMQELLWRLGYERKGHEGGELVYEKRHRLGTRLTLYARYADAEGDEWVNQFRLALRASPNKSFDLLTCLTPPGGDPLDLVGEETILDNLTWLTRRLEAYFTRLRKPGRTRGGTEPPREPSPYSEALSEGARGELESAVRLVLREELKHHTPHVRELKALTSRLVLTLVSRLRPDLLSTAQFDPEEALAVTAPNLRTALVELKFEGEIQDDERLATNIVQALAAECESGNGLADECTRGDDGWTQTITVTVNGARAARDLRP